MVPLAASLTLWSNHCLCKSVYLFDAGTGRSHSFLSSSSSSLPGMREHPPIPVIDLADHIERLKANDGLRFSQEYEVRARHQCGTEDSCSLEHLIVFLCYCVLEEHLLFDFMCMHSNGLWKTPFIDSLQSFLQLYYISHQESNTYIKCCEILFHKTSRWRVASAICVRLAVSLRNAILQAVSNATQLRDYLLSVFLLTKKKKIK